MASAGIIAPEGAPGNRSCADQWCLTLHIFMVRRRENPVCRAAGSRVVVRTRDALLLWLHTLRSMHRVLTLCTPEPLLHLLAGRTAAAGLRASVAHQSNTGGGKSGLHGDTVAANGRRGRPQGKCHRKQTAFGSPKVRVKGCGKSAPRRRQRRWQGKPHREQDQIGVAGRASEEAASGPSSDPPPGLVARGVQQWASQTNGRRGGKPPDRTRLTGQLALS